MKACCWLVSSLVYAYLATVDSQDTLPRKWCYRQRAGPSYISENYPIKTIPQGMSIGQPDKDKYSIKIPLLIVSGCIKLIVNAN